MELGDNGEPMQTIDDSETFSLQLEESTDIEIEKSKFIEPFNIVGNRLFRIRLLKDSEHYYLLQDTSTWKWVTPTCTEPKR